MMKIKCKISHRKMLETGFVNFIAGQDYDEAEVREAHEGSIPTLYFDIPKPKTMKKKEEKDNASDSNS